MGKILLIALVVVAAVWALFPRTSPYPRETIVLAGDPIAIFSWDSGSKTLTRVYLPADLVTEGTHGYGQYSLEAFWRLGEIDKKDGTVLSESVAEAIGIPVTYYIGPTTGMFAADLEVFTLRNIVSYVTRRYRTNIPFRTFIGLSWLLQASKPDHVNTYDFSKQPALIARDTAVPDGSKQWVLDVPAMDLRLKGVFEDERVRREGVSIAVYNTTAMPSLGERTARLLSHLGVSVVAVGNEAIDLDTCLVTGTKEMLKSMSAKVTMSVLGCEERIATESGRADLSVRMGEAAVKRFTAN